MIYFEIGMIIIKNVEVLYIDYLLVVSLLLYLINIKYTSTSLKTCMECIFENLSFMDKILITKF